MKKPGKGLKATAENSNLKETETGTPSSNHVYHIFGHQQRRPMFLVYNFGTYYQSNMIKKHPSKTMYTLHDMVDGEKAVQARPPKFSYPDDKGSNRRKTKLKVRNSND